MDTNVIKLLQILDNISEKSEVNGNEIEYYLHCIYCGFSKHHIPHLGVKCILNQEGNNKLLISGCVNCFRCGNSKSLKGFLYDLIKYNIVPELNEIIKKIKFKKYDNLNYNKPIITHNLFQNISINHNNLSKIKMRALILALFFVKNKLKLNLDISIKNAIWLSKYLDYTAFEKNGKFIISFKNFIYYIFNKENKMFKIKLNTYNDVSFFGTEYITHNFNFSKYIKKERKHRKRHYKIFIENIESEYDTINIISCEGIFDAYTVILHKYIFDFNKIFSLSQKECNIYTIAGNSNLENPVFHFLNNIVINNFKLNFDNVKKINIIFISDANRNGFKYVEKFLNRTNKNKKILKWFKNFDVNFFYSKINNKYNNISDINESIENPKVIITYKVNVII